MAAPWRTAPLPPDWPARRLAVLERDGWTCRLRGPRCEGAANECDHIGANTDHRLENLQAACRTCHRSKTGRQGRAAQPKRKREPEPHPGFID